MRRMLITLAAIAALALTASGKGDEGALRCTITGKIVKSCCRETAANGHLHCTLANKDIKKCCCEPARSN